MSEHKKETEVMREHIVWLSNELVKAREQIRHRDNIMRDMLNPDIVGWAVPQEIRAAIYNLFSQEREVEVQSWNRK